MASPDENAAGDLAMEPSISPSGPSIGLPVGLAMGYLASPPVEPSEIEPHPWRCRSVEVQPNVRVTDLDNIPDDLDDSQDSCSIGDVDEIRPSVLTRSSLITGQSANLLSGMPRATLSPLAGALTPFPGQSLGKHSGDGALSPEASTAESETGLLGGLSLGPPLSQIHGEDALHTDAYIEYDTEIVEDFRYGSEDDFAVVPEVADDDARGIASMSSMHMATFPEAYSLGAEDIAVPVPPNMVRLNIYDLHASISTLNDFLQETVASGLYHVGVEVYGIEFMYAAGEYETGRSTVQACPVGSVPSSCGTSSSSSASPTHLSGVVWHSPRKHSFHSYKRTVNVGQTHMSMWSVFEMVSEMAAEWAQADYHMLLKNCIHFADAFCISLGCDTIPDIFFGGGGKALQDSLENRRPLYEQVSDGVSSVTTALTGLLPSYLCNSATPLGVEESTSTVIRALPADGTSWSDGSDSEMEEDVSTFPSLDQTQALPPSLSAKTSRAGSTRGRLDTPLAQRVVRPPLLPMWTGARHAEENADMEEVDIYKRVPPSHVVRTMNFSPSKALARRPQPKNDVPDVRYNTRSI